MSKRQEERLALKREAMLEAAQRWEQALETGFKRIESVDRPIRDLRQINYARRESMRSQKGLTEVVEELRRVEEAQIDTWDAENRPPHSKAALLGKPVCRILETTDGANRGFGTGFLISDHLLMTNHHVFPDYDMALDCEANFGYEYTEAGTLSQGVRFDILPDKFFVKCKELDFAIVGIEQKASSGNASVADLGCIPLIETPGKVIKGEDINIIQYPLGGYKQYAYKQNQVIEIFDGPGFIQYITDTAKASSGSPCFNRSWELAALHHCAIPKVVGGKIMTKAGTEWDERDEDEVAWVSNEGISISKIVEYLKANLNQFTTNNLKYLQELLRSVDDPLFKEGGQEEVKMPPQANERIIIPQSNNKAMSQFSFYFQGSTVINIYATSDGRPSEIVPQVPNQAAEGSKMLVDEAPAIRFDEDYENREEKGYKADFLEGYEISEPSVEESRLKDLYSEDGEPYVAKYYNYSLVMNKKRRFCMWTAANVNYDPEVRSKKSRTAFGRDKWRPDPRIPDKYQVTGKELYDPATRVEQGHIVRRDDTCWGEDALSIEYANSDTFHYTNCTPQLEPFNRANPRPKEGYEGIHGIWGALEEHIKKELKNVDNRAIIFAGPYLSQKDPLEDFGMGKIKYPLKFWKVVCILDEEGKLFSYGFWLDQTDVVREFGLGLERLDFRSFKKQQMPIKEISRRTGVYFDEQVYASDAIKFNQFNESGRKGIPYQDVSEIQVRPEGNYKVGEDWRTLDLEEDEESSTERHVKTYIVTCCPRDIDIEDLKDEHKLKENLKYEPTNFSALQMALHDYVYQKDDSKSVSYDEVTSNKTVASIVKMVKDKVG